MGGLYAPPGPAPPDVGALGRDEAEPRRGASPPGSPSCRRLAAPLLLPPGGSSRSVLSGMIMGSSGLDITAVNPQEGGVAMVGGTGAYPEEAPVLGLRQFGTSPLSSNEAGPGALCTSPRSRARALSLDERRDGSPMPSARGRDSSVPGRAASPRQLYGPERFYYDTSTFTGVHRYGGPSILDKCGINMYSGLDEMVRPHLRRGGTFMSSHGNPLSKKCPEAFLLPMREEERLRWEMQRLRKSTSSSQLLGPDRFYSDRSTYTGIHRFSPGGPLELEMSGQYPGQREILPPDAPHMGNYVAPDYADLAVAQLPDECVPWPHEPIESARGPGTPLPRPPLYDQSGAACGVPDGLSLPGYDYGDQVAYGSAPNRVWA